MRHFYNKIRKNLLIICPILNLQGCKQIDYKNSDSDIIDSDNKYIMMRYALQKKAKKTKSKKSKKAKKAKSKKANKNKK